MRTDLKVWICFRVYILAKDYGSGQENQKICNNEADDLCFWSKAERPGEGKGQERKEESRYNSQAAIISIVLRDEHILYPALWNSLLITHFLNNIDHDWLLWRIIMLISSDIYRLIHSKIWYIAGIERNQNDRTCSELQRTILPVQHSVGTPVSHTRRH